MQGTQINPDVVIKIFLLKKKKKTRTNTDLHTETYTSIYLVFINSNLQKIKKKRHKICSKKVDDLKCSFVSTYFI